MLHNKKMFLVKIVQKITGNQKAGDKQSKKSRKIRERKNETKGNQSKSKKASKKFVNLNLKRKYLYNLSKVARF